jgi:hypothetical protein
VTLLSSLPAAFGVPGGASAIAWKRSSFSLSASLEEPLYSSPSFTL